MRVVQRERIKPKDKPKSKPKSPKRIESKKIIKKQAEKFGWLVKEKGRWQLELTKPFTKDLIKVDIMKDGKIKFDVPGIISGPNHANAENFLRDVTAALKAKVISLVHHVQHAMAFAGASHTHHHH